MVEENMHSQPSLSPSIVLLILLSSQQKIVSPKRAVERKYEPSPFVAVYLPVLSSCPFLKEDNIVNLPPFSSICSTSSLSFIVF